MQRSRESAGHRHLWAGLAVSILTLLICALGVRDELQRSRAAVRAAQRASPFGPDSGGLVSSRGH